MLQETATREERVLYLRGFCGPHCWEQRFGNKNDQHKDYIQTGLGEVLSFLNCKSYYSWLFLVFSFYWDIIMKLKEWPPVPEFAEIVFLILLLVFSVLNCKAATVSFCLLIFHMKPSCHTDHTYNCRSSCSHMDYAMRSLSLFTPSNLSK